MSPSSMGQGMYIQPELDFQCCYLHYLRLKPSSTKDSFINVTAIMCFSYPIIF